MTTKSVHIVFCGAWGYASRFRKVKAFLEQQLGSSVVVTGEATPTASGAFEVTLKGTDKKFWSKLGGQGYLDGDEENLKKVAEAIRSA